MLQKDSRLYAELFRSATVALAVLCCSTVLVHAQSVKHDATLTGAGTNASPLGVASGGIGTTQLSNGSVTNGKIAASAVDTNKIADGAVTASKVANGAISAPKIGTPTAPIDGQVLTFSGTGLAWQTPAGAGALRVVDSTGKEVGFFGIDPVNQDVTGVGALFYKADLSQWIRIALGTNGFNEVQEDLLFTTPDCTGTAYVFAGPNLIFFKEGMLPME